VLREYEITVIINGQLSEDDSKKVQAKYENILLADGGEIVKKNDWGVRKLAFPMKSQHRGHYLSYDLTTKPEHLAEAERLMRIDDNMLRYLSVKIGENINVADRKAELAKFEAQAALQRESAHA
jgi:small subunit ribosomal protein S6